MKLNATMIKIFASIWILLVSIPAVSAQASVFTLPEGTKIRVKMDNEISSRFSNVNDTFTVTVAESVFNGGTEILPNGIVIEGRILAAKAAALGRANGDIEVHFNKIFPADEKSQDLDASLVKTNLVGETSPNFSKFAIIGGAGLGAVIGGLTRKGAGVLFGGGIGAGAGIIAALSRKGNEAGIKAREVFEIRLNKELVLPVRDF